MLFINTQLSPARVHRLLSSDALKDATEANKQRASYTRYAHQRMPLHVQRNALLGARAAIRVGRPLTLAGDAIFGTGQPTGHVTDVGVLPAFGHFIAMSAAATGCLLGTVAGVVSAPVAWTLGKPAKSWIAASARWTFDTTWYVAARLRQPVQGLENSISAALKGALATLGALVGVVIGIPGYALEAYRGEVSHDSHRPGEPCFNKTTLVEMEPLEEVDSRFFCRLDNDQGYDIRELEDHILSQRRWTAPEDLSLLSQNDLARLARHPSGIGQRIITRMAAIQSNQSDIRTETLERLLAYGRAMIEDGSDDGVQSATALLQMRDLLMGLPDSEIRALNAHVAHANGGTLSERLHEVLTKSSCTRVFAHGVAKQSALLLAGRKGHELSAREQAGIDQAYAASEFRFLIARHAQAGAAKVQRTLGRQR